MKRSTIKDVAREAGVSVSAVSRVCSKDASASPEMRAKVRAAAEILGYRPSQLAAGLVQGSTNLLTFVTGPSYGTFDLLFLEALTAAVSRSGFRLMLAAGDDGGEMGGLLQALDYQSDAVIISAGTLSRAQSEMCLRAGLPVILVGRESDDLGIHCVLPDNTDGGRQAGDLLVRTGCRRIAYLGRGGATFADVELREGVRSAVEAAGLELTTGATAGRQSEDHFRAALSLLTRTDRPDGVFCGSDSIAIGVVEAARALSLDVPRDVSVIGFNNGPDAVLRSFKLSSVDYPIDMLVEAIMGILASQTGPERSRGTIRIPTRIIPRATTRA